jgi:hypothetical protein
VVVPSPAKSAAASENIRDDGRPPFGSTEMASQPAMQPSTPRTIVGGTLD